ncbi:MerR family transcriptional regulator [Listeria monocytogenes]|uniref:MerR family transcriptional regulator n=1 Tax=Listeria monocytogenes TaxID=1639 RepID=A0A826CLZ9_LISMN|nr:MerR family transcriptional regulator [Listeria monocytogenes]EAE6055155.1 MerR family transcriptional regulator [Listeria monocytogenes serotype 1/2b]ARJ45207.1 MerR family transcriptional regulator [Listeria monocytogenes]EAC2359291.1 MerR family transcriptional regulator [Listeria monocytogenes]EAC2491860.1 MerR family transcriptional regulator [Listeria monocytogenes]EAC2549710.1 MerR family transcriptional regulator [Listeria monocytogenes]
MNYTIGAFSREVELSIDTLRYYEKEKLILPKRNEINRRIYDSSDITWINFIKKLKQTGMPIKDIKEYAKLRYLEDQTIEQRMTLLYKQYDVSVEKREEIELYTQFLLNKIDIYKEMLSERDIK